MLTASRLLDPSCSGSGIVNRLDYLVDQGEFREFSRWELTACPDVDEEADAKSDRLEKLAAFQLSMILHAFTCEFGSPGSQCGL